LAPDIAEQLEIDAKYAVYLERQAADVAAFRRDESLELPENINYAGVPGLSNEVRQKLTAIRPRTIGQAGRIDGITPAALALLAIHLRRPGRGARRHACGRGLEAFVKCWYAHRPARRASRSGPGPGRGIAARPCFT
jgi:hypothetical protein